MAFLGSRHMFPGGRRPTDYGIIAPPRAHLPFFDYVCGQLKPPGYYKVNKHISILLDFNQTVLKFPWTKVRSQLIIRHYFHYSKSELD